MLVVFLFLIFLFGFHGKLWIFFSRVHKVKLLLIFRKMHSRLSPVFSWKVFVLVRYVEFGHSSVISPNTSNVQGKVLYGCLNGDHASGVKWLICLQNCTTTCRWYFSCVWCFGRHAQYTQAATIFWMKLCQNYLYRSQRQPPSK